MITDGRAGSVHLSGLQGAAKQLSPEPLNTERVER